MCTLQSFPWKCQECSVAVSPTRASVVWKIRDFSKIDTKAGDYLKSQQFQFLNATWMIDIFPSGDRESKVGEVTLYLCRISSTVESQNVKYKLFYRDKFTDEYLAEEFVTKFNNKNGGYGPVSRIKREDLLDGELRDRLLAEDTLTVCCEVRDADAEEPEDPPTDEILSRENSSLRKTVSGLRKEVQEQADEIRCLRDKLAEDLRLHRQPVGRDSEGVTESLNNEQKVISEGVATVYEETLFPDVTLRVGGEDLPAHKAILSSRSSVFRGMFDSDMKESREHVAEIQEMEAQTARQMLRYVYTGKVCDLEDESAKSLYVAADRYDLKGLKARCQQYLLRNVSVDNVCQLALLADLHADEKLKSAVKLFLCKNRQIVLQSAIWKESVAENPVFFVELISSVLMNMDLVPKNVE